jgi:hypothetical protein
MPGEGLPATRLDDARTELHAALRRVWTALGWPADAATPFPPPEPVAPGAWVEIPTVHQAPDRAAGAVAATFPVVFVVDGAEEQQMKLQDRLLAYGWQELAAVNLGTEAAPQRVTVQTAGPEDVDVGPGTVRGLVFRVQVILQRKTLCPQKLTRDNDEGTTP